MGTGGADSLVGAMVGASVVAARPLVCSVDHRRGFGGHAVDGWVGPLDTGESVAGWAALAVERGGLVEVPLARCADG
jgi:hypothetical protein